MPGGLPDSADNSARTAPSIKYTVPAGWQESAGGEMRVASFRILADGKQAEVGVVPLPGLMGRDLETVNRWRGTVGLEPAKEDDLPKLAEAVQIGGETGQLFDQDGENPGSGEKSRILGAIARHEGVAWFFKMTGDSAVVAKEKPAFISFLKSVSFEAASPAATGVASAGAGGLPPSHPPIGDASFIQAANASGSSNSGKPAWQTPPGWQEANAGQFLVAKYLIAGPDNTQASVNVSSSGGTGGGIAANVNRWRGQLGLGELPEGDITKQLSAVETGAGKAFQVQISGTDSRSGQKASIVGIIVPQDGQTWFYKLMGNDQLVERQKEAFTKFVQSARYPQ